MKYQMTFIFLFIFLILMDCKKQEKKIQKNSRPVVSEEGKKIAFSDDSPGLEVIEAQEFGKGADFIAIQAPARIIASISTSVSQKNKIVLFESPEINALYADFIHSKNAMRRASKNMARVNDMYKNQVATEKDRIEAEADASNAQAEYAEYEGKLRALGFNPNELQSVRSNIIWLICDIPEGNMRAINKGKRVKIKFTSFPDQNFEGKAEAIGDNIDPSTRTVKVRISMPNKNGMFKPGMFAKAEFEDKSENTNAAVPFTAVFSVEGQSYVFIQTNLGEFERRAVVIGSTGIDQAAIISGVKNGELVVIKGTMLLKGLSFGY